MHGKHGANKIPKSAKGKRKATGTMTRVKLTATIRKGQIWEHESNGQLVEVTGKKGSKIKTRVLTATPGIFGKSHTFIPQSLVRNFKLLK